MGKIVDASKRDHKLLCLLASCIIESDGHAKDGNHKINSSAKMIQELEESEKRSYSSSNEIEATYKKLFDITESGFFTDSKVAIYGTENSKELNAIVDDFRQNLWQAREFTDCFVILSKKIVSSFEIPEICEAFERSISYIRRFAIPENTEEEKEALRIEARLNKILSAYQYMEFGIAVKTDRNIQFMEKIFANDRNKKLKDIMMSAFDSQSDEN